MQNFGIKILSTGSYVPERVVKNEDFAAFLDTSDEWITTRTGMKERHLSQGEPTWYMGSMAAKEAIALAGIEAQDIGLIILASVTPDFFTPSTSCVIQREIGAIGCMTIDINCACSGYVYALDMARRYLVTDENIKYAVVIGAENLSKLADYSDRSSCILFGDGAAACVVELSKDGIYSSYLGADGNGAKFMFARNIPMNNAFMPPIQNRKTYPDGLGEGIKNYLAMDGKEVYKFAVKAFPDAVNKAAEKIGMSVKDIDWIVPHQANIRIIETAIKNLEISLDKCIINIERFGNTSSASIPICLDEAIRLGKIKRGDKICLVAFGAGLTYGAVIFTY